MTDTYTLTYRSSKSGDTLLHPEASLVWAKQKVNGFYKAFREIAEPGETVRKTRNGVTFRRSDGYTLRVFYKKN